MGGVFEALAAPTSEDWRSVSHACLGLMLVNASWIRDHFFDSFADLVNTVNVAKDIFGIQRKYPSVTASRFPDELHEPSYTLLANSSCDLGGRLVHMYKAPIKELDSAMRKCAVIHEQRQDPQHPSHG